jgi:hypothetical protein
MMNMREGTHLNIDLHKELQCKLGAICITTASKKQQVFAITSTDEHNTAI